jgi:asparagine synthase (glutamine-hydrolysing)
MSSMGKLMAHRGPDDRGLSIFPEYGLALGHNRLSIIDLSSAGHQPMATTDGQIVVSFNGEIYNFQTLRRELQKRGHLFASRSDTEVIILGYREWGEQVFERLHGMFALALWDSARKSLLLVRDPAGMKPLYHWRDGEGSVYFASEVKAFLGIPEFQFKFDRRAVSQYLEFNFIYDDIRCSIEGVEKVPPGHMLNLSLTDRPILTQFFSPAQRASSESINESIEKRVEALHETFETVVAEHMIADVPVALLLSGGLDSSLVTALASRHRRVNTISFAFSDSAIDETSYAKEVSDFLGTEHQRILIRPEEIIEQIPKSAWYIDDLFGDWGLVSTQVLYRRCSEEGVKVVLVGEGADELFGGYYAHEMASARKPGWPLSLKLYRWYSGRRWGGELQRFALMMNKFYSEFSEDSLAAVRHFEARHQMPNHYNMKVDRASMSVSVEARSPFQDIRLAKLAYATPSEFLIRDGQTKWLLREMARRFKLLPPNIIERRKFGASMANSWMSESVPFRAFAQEVVLDRSGLVDEFGLRKAMTCYFETGRTGYGPPSGISLFGVLAWRLLLLNLWHAAYKGHRKELVAE